MSTSRRRFDVVEGNASESSSTLRRDVALALVVAAIVLWGTAAGTFSPQPAPEMTLRTEDSAAQLAHEFVYFPSQYVNQGTEVPEPVATF